MSEWQKDGDRALRFGHYRLGRVLGEGGFGRVHAAWDERLQRTVAIKFVRGDQQRQETLRYEAQRLAAQLHPAFVEVYALEEYAGRLGMVMEFVRDRTLAEALRQDGPLPVDRALRFGIQAAGALAAAHRSGWAHGDIKPSNLMLDDGGMLRILDFGASAALDPLDTTSLSSGDVVAGTLAYLPPERLLGVRVDASGDIYSLGLVLYETLAGGPARSDGDGWRSLQHLHGDQRGLVLPAGFDEGFRDLVERMTRRIPQARPPSMDQVLEDLLRLETSSTQRAAVRRRTPWGRRTAAAALALCLLGLTAGERPRNHASGLGQAESSIAARVLAAERRMEDFDRPGALADAAARLERILKNEPTHAPAAALLGIVYCLRYAGDERDDIWLTRATEASRLAVRLEPQLALAHAARGWAEEYLGHDAQAESHYRHALTLDPSDRYALLGLARLHVASKRSADAAAVLQDALARHPRQRWFHDTLGTLAYQQGDLAGAERAFRKSIEIKPDGVQAYTSLSAILLRQQRPEAALAVLQQAMRHGANARLYGNLGTVLFALGRYGEAADAFEQAVSESRGSPNDYLKWANLADALRWLPGREADAREAYMSALRMSEVQLARYPDSVTLSSRVALYAARLGRFAQARERAESTIARAPRDADVLFRAALVAELSGSRDVAIERLRRAIEQGYPPHMIASEPDLLALRRDRRYHSMLTGTSP